MARSRGIDRKICSNRLPDFLLIRMVRVVHDGMEREANHGKLATAEEFVDQAVPPHDQGVFLGVADASSKYTL